MTSNQISYWGYKEGKRHNITSERETERHNRAQESIQAAQVSESERANKMRELQNFVAMAETHRSNIAKEDATQFHYTTERDHLIRQDAEAARHNLVQEGVTYSSFIEAARHNRESEHDVDQGRTIDWAEVVVKGWNAANRTAEIISKARNSTNHSPIFSTSNDAAN